MLKNEEGDRKQMKKAIKVLNILTMVASGFLAVICLFGSCAVCSNPEMAEVATYTGGTMFVCIIIALIPLFVCYFANKKLEEATTKSDLTVIAIVTLLLGSTISGILMLIIDDYELNK